ncbi:MAG: FecR family protein, partial [Verrucomicrobiota bacterium]
MEILTRAAIITSLFIPYLAPSVLTAGPLTQAHVTKIFNQVQVVDPRSGSHSASLDEVIKDEIGLKTGVKSRSELLFEDNTLTRIGPETFFTFKAGTRDMTLQKGTMLLQVPKGLGGAKIRTAAITASITGTTIMIEHTPGKTLKVLVLEGSLRLSVNGTFGDALVLTPGRMVIMRPDAKRIPDPVAVDLARVVRTSSLVKMDKKQGAPLPSIDLINKEIAVQQHEKGRANLIATNLVIEGHGTNVMLASDEVLGTIEQRTRGSDDPFLLVSNSNGNGHHGRPSPTPNPS